MKYYGHVERFNGRKIQWPGEIYPPTYILVIKTSERTEGGRQGDRREREEREREREREKEGERGRERQREEEREGDRERVRHGGSETGRPGAW